MVGHRVRGWMAVCAVGIVATAGLTGCAESSEGNSSGGEGIEFGASKAEYVKALEDVSPITIKTQSPSPKGSLTGAKFEGYMKAVEDWSDGKIKFDIAYSNAVAEPTEVDNALNDGRLDMGSVVLAYEPQDYPANALLAEATFAGAQGPLVGVMESNAWWLDVAYNTDEIFDEMDAVGGFMLMPAFNSGLISLNCKDPITSLDDLDGLQVIAGTQAQSDTLKSLGAVPISMAYPEIYESLQRGVADCSMNSLLVSQLGGFESVVPNATVGLDAGFGSGPGGLAFSKATWDSYPLVVQQLLFDRLDAFMVSNLESIFQVNSEVTTALSKAGGDVSDYGEDAREKIQSLNAAALEEMRDTDAVADGGAWVNYLKDSVDKWDTAITDDLGYGDEIPYDDFADFYATEKPDLQPYVDAIFEDILLPHRPS